MTWYNTFQGTSHQTSTKPPLPRAGLQGLSHISKPSSTSPGLLQNSALAPPPFPPPPIHEAELAALGSGSGILKP